MKQKNKKRKKIAPILWTLFIIIMLICGVSVWYIFRLLNDIRPIQSPEIQGIRKNFKINWGGRINILLMGCDSREGYDLGIRSDTLIVANLDLKDKTVRVMSIPRDTRVYVPDHDTYDKMNSTINPNYFSNGGIPLTLRTLEHLLGIPIKLYAMLDFEAFEQVVDILGGVMLEVEKDMYYYDPTDGTMINLKEGYQQLDGHKALQYVRFRWDHQGDYTRDYDGQVYGRVSRQLKFLSALAGQIAENRNILRINHIINAVAKKFETNMDTAEMLKLAILFKDLNPETQFKVVNFPGDIDYIHDISYVVTDEEELSKLIHSEFIDQTNIPEDPETNE